MIGFVLEDQDCAASKYGCPVQPENLLDVLSLNDGVWSCLHRLPTEVPYILSSCINLHPTTALEHSDDSTPTINITP